MLLVCRCLKKYVCVDLSLSLSFSLSLSVYIYICIQYICTPSLVFCMITIIVIMTMRSVVRLGHVLCIYIYIYIIITTSATHTLLC